ncbi:MAG TPA: glucokinase, partial [Nevskiaceae bacterium]|nr:glucokinase [Nevskiaceae bacterium]
MILVGDVGGTNTRLGLAAREAGEWRLSHLRVEPTPQELGPLLRGYLAASRPPSVTAIAICGAGPKRPDGTLSLTNHPLVLDPAKLAKDSGIARVAILNDFEAVAWSLPALGETGTRAFGGGTRVARAPCVVLGAGTGLGVAALVPAGANAWTAAPGEGGHVDLAPVDDEELAAWTRLRAQLGRVSAEHVLSGAGLERLHTALHGVKVEAPAISQALADGDAQAVTTVRVFSRWLGRVAGDLALTLVAKGGVYIAGGIVPGWKDR